MLVPQESSSAVLVMTCSKSVTICNRFHVRWANSGKITISKGGTPLWCPRSRGISSPSDAKITSLETRDPRLPYGENPESLSHLGLIRYRVVTPQTDRRTDRIAIANTRSQQYLPVQLSCVEANLPTLFWPCFQKQQILGLIERIRLRLRTGW